MPQHDDVRVQAEVFSRYLIKQAPSRSAVDLFVRAMTRTETSLSPADAHLLAFVMRHPKSLAFVDSGLVFYRPHSEVRRRLYIMLAILESQPEYTAQFLPTKRSPGYVLFVGYCGLRAIVKSLVGMVLVGVIR